MFLLNQTLPTPAFNLAFDEALLEAADQSQLPQGLELLRIWELPHDCIVLGRSSRADVEVRLQQAVRDGVPVLRRASGGATVIHGPGCLVYSVLLSYDKRPHLRQLDVMHAEVMGTLQKSLARWNSSIAMEGTCDLTLDGLKFSGNALQCKRNYALYHGTLLYNFDLAKISRYLLEPPRQPDYRQRRPHDAFVTNLPLTRAQLATSLVEAWSAKPLEQDSEFSSPIRPWLPTEETLLALCERKYFNPAWNKIELSQE